MKERSQTHSTEYTMTLSKGPAWTTSGHPHDFTSGSYANLGHGGAYYRAVARVDAGRSSDIISSPS